MSDSVFIDCTREIREGNILDYIRKVFKRCEGLQKITLIGGNRQEVIYHLIKRNMIGVRFPGAGCHLIGTARL